MDRCPNCKARLDGADTCRRCGMELRLLLAAERAAAVYLGQAVARLRAGDQAGATARLRRSLALHQTPLAAALAGFASARGGPGAAPTAEVASADADVGC